ncbi:General transcription factor II-I repeat domain-containing protein 2 [Thelohanellus kitauei]|uniref:General transcription factor II-I repeat domain-containing protein 2 n=1 Tax=Thelohanellus kitauei TaxID=669202 RepID=A0A0C2NAC8_THEKT|nr:General transcription factor II-I repeat domain-containing protein 2 [Thelohanellus kitauei]
MKRNDAEYPQLRVSLWLSDLAFALDLFEHMEELNTKLQGNGVFVHEMYYVVKAVQVKLKLFSNQISQKITTHFPTLETMALQIASTKKYTNTISALDIEFTRRFGDFQKLSGEFDILKSPITSDFEKALAALQ